MPAGGSGGVSDRRPGLEPRPTVFIWSARLCDAVGVDITLASETCQHTGSFKFRGAFNTARHTPAAHLVAASSGNFGQALAYACLLHGKRCTIVMPTDAIAVKVAAVRRHGAAVERVDTSVQSRAAYVEDVLARHPEAVQVFPSDGELMLAGNESLGAEIVTHEPAFNTVVAPVGGGGVVVGLIRARDRAGLKTTIVAAEPAAANDVAQSFRAGRRVVLGQEPVTLADGVRVNVSEGNWPVIHGGCAGVVEVEESRIVEAMRLLYSIVDARPEPTGALSLAAVLSAPERFRGRRVCCIVTGGNVDPELFERLVEDASA